MKKMLMLIPFLLSICFMFAQVSEYTFVQSNQAYTEITGGTVVITGNIDDTQYAVTPPFAFTFNSTAVTAMAMSSNGYLSFNAALNSFGYTAISSAAVGTGVAAPMSRDLRGRPDGEMRWEVLGTAPNRTAVYQWKNWTAYGTGYENDNWNFQVILYETTNDIAFRYGPFTFVSTYTNTAQVGLRGETNAAFINRTTTTSWNATTAGTANNATCAITSTIYPANGLQFRFNYPVANQAPNPAIVVSPLNGAVGVMTSASLNWASGGGLPTGYRLNFGTNTPPTNLVNNMDLGAVNTYTPASPMQMNTTYYWQIIPYNGFGNAVNCPVWSFTTGGAVILMSNGTQAVPDGVTYSFFDSGGPDGTYQNSENYTFTFTAATPSSTLEIAFSFFSLESGWDYLRIYDGPNASSPQIGPLEGYTGTTSPGTFEVGNAVTFVFTSDTSVLYDGWAATVTAIASLPNDLQAYSITGPTGPAVGTPADYTILVRNRGTANQSTYTVQLMSGTTVLASVPGPAILSGASIPVVVSHTFTAQGPVTVFGRVVLAGDQVPANNDTAPLNLVVQPAGTALVEIGDGIGQQGQPFYVFWDYTRSASLYTFQELNIGGVVSGVKWYCSNVGTVLPNIPYKVYLKNVTETAMTSNTWSSMIDGATLMLDSSYVFNTVGWHTFYFPTPFVYTGGSLLVLVEANIGAYISGGPQFYFTAGVTGTHQYWFADGTPPPGNGTLNANRPNIGLFFITSGLGHVSGIVSSGATPIAGAHLTVDGTPYNATSMTDGSYTIQYLPQGLQNVTCTKVGYYTQTLPVTIVENQTATLNFNMVAQPQVSVTGLVTGSDAPTVGLANAEVTLTGVLVYTATTNATGNFTIPNVLAGNTYAYTVTRQGYQTGTGSITIGTTNYNMGTIVLNEIALPAAAVQAVETPPNVTITWRVPGTAGGEWLQYDTGLNEDSIGLTSGGTFDYAARWPADDLTDFVGMSLFAVRFFPGDNATFSLRVWTGGSATAPGPLVVDQPVTNFTVDAFNTVILNNPVNIQAGQELWIGFNVTHPAGFYPAGCDGGPSHNGFGNMLNYQNVWTTLYNEAPSLNYDWNLAGYVGWSPPDPAPLALARYRALERKIVVDGNGQFAARLSEPTVAPTGSTGSSMNTRSLLGYKVWRLLQGNETNEPTWSLLTTNTIPDTSYVDTAWGAIPEGDYKWAVKAVYTNNVLSPAAVSNMVMKRPNDLSALTIAGSLTPSVGALMNYTVTIKNTGTAAQAAGSYTVKIMSGTTELGSTAGPAIAAGQILDVVVGWTPAAEGNVTIYGKAVLPTDTLPTNDETPPITVLVYPAGTLLTEIGTGTSTQRQPFGIYYDYERDASLYTQAEIGAYGAITALKWYVGTANPFVVPYKIYLKTTTDATLTAVPWATMITDAQLMLDATYSFSQVGWVTFNFTTPFIYTSGNLLVLVETNVGDWQSSYAVFRYSTAPAGHHLYWYQDGSAPTGNGTPNTNRPNIGIFLLTAGLGHVSGTVTSGTTPIEGALLTVVNTAYNGTTNASGVYTIQYIPEGPQNVTCYKVGYYSQTLPVTIVENQTATLNFNLVSLPQVNVTGMVVGSDAPTVGLAGATVALTGMVDYTATTNAAGNFTIPGVYASQTYNYTITKAGYSPASGSITVGTTNFSMGTITLNEIAYPATGVQAAEAIPNVNISWTAPDPNVQNFEDSFETYTDFALDFPPWTCLDIDQSDTYGYTGISFPGVYDPMAYIILNPLTTTPPSTAQLGTAHTGDKMASCWASTTPPNNDWLISPQVSVPPNGVVKFWARSLTADYGLERFHVGVSTTGTAPADFTIISGATYVQAPVDWTEYTYQLTSYAGQNVKIGIRCVSNDAFVFMVDDFFVGVPNRSLEAPAYNPPVLVYNHRPGAKVTGISLSDRIVQRIPGAPVIQDYDTRSLTGYKVWRLLEGQESNEAAWTLLTPNTITATAYQDMGWAQVPDGNYKWAVKAVYTGDVLSTAALSNMVPKQTQIGTIAGLVRNTSNQPIAGATVAAGTATATTNTTGAYSLQVNAGTYTVTCTAAGYVTGTQTGVVVVTGQTTPVNFILAPANLVTDGYETYDNFAIAFSPWVNVDVDQSTTYTITGVTFLHGGEAMAYIVFNPSATTPPLTTPAWTAHGGSKYAACFAATTPPNNDWLISQLFENVGENASVGFWAKSVTAQYGLERFKVGVSTGGTAPANFTFISGASYVTAPIDWTWFEYDIPASYVGQDIRVGIQCVSNDAFVFMVDDFVMDLGTVSNVDPVTPVVATALNGNFPNPFNPETTISYSVKGTSPTVIEIYNTKGQKVKTLVNETKAEGHYQAKWDGRDDNNQPVTSGVYFYRMKSGKFTSSRKMILLK